MRKHTPNPFVKPGLYCLCAGLVALMIILAIQAVLWAIGGDANFFLFILPAIPFVGAVSCVVGTVLFDIKHNGMGDR